MANKDNEDLTDMRCGVGLFSLPDDDPMTPYCKMHDLEYIEGGTLEDKERAEDNFKRGCEFIAETKPSFRTWLESKILPPIAKWCGFLFWKPYSRLAEYLKQGREKAKKENLT